MYLLFAHAVDQGRSNIRRRMQQTCIRKEEEKMCMISKSKAKRVFHANRQQKTAIIEAPEDRRKKHSLALVLVRRTAMKRARGRREDTRRPRRFSPPPTGGAATTMRAPTVPEQAAGSESRPWVPRFSVQSPIRGRFVRSFVGSLSLVRK